MSFQEALEALCDPPSGPARALHPSCYTDPAFWRSELEHVLRPAWHPIARSDELPDVGDYRSIELFGEPVLLLRDESGRLRAFSRVCLHRAIPIVEGEGNTRRFTCPYHRWGYDLDGRLRAAPLMEQVEGFDRDGCRLPELGLEEWLGFVLVNLDPGAEPLAARVSEIERLMRPLDLAGYRLAGTLEFDSPWNWKVLVENFMESYHHLGPHVQSLQPTNPAAGTHALALDAEGAVLENPAAPGASPFWVAHVFPTLLFVAFHDAEIRVGVWYEMKIDAMDRFRLRIHVLLPPGGAENEALVGGVLERLAQVHAEDITVCDGVWKGLGSRLFRGTALAQQEGCLVRFHRHLAERMQAARIGIRGGRPAD